MQALFFDCDGVLAETELDLHRVAFNDAFRELDIHAHWDEQAYGPLLQVAGGRERLRYWFDSTGWPVAESKREMMLDALHATKSTRFRALLAEGGIAPRPGVVRLAGEALSAGLPVAVCSTSQQDSVRAVVRTIFPPAHATRIGVFAGDMVKAKKPDPAIYLLAAETLDVDPARCVVIEDSRIGLRAATGAGMCCIVTPSHYTIGEDFSSARQVVPDLGDAPVRVTLDSCRELCDRITPQQPAR